MREIEFRLDGDTLIHQGAPRALTKADWARFDDWVKQYHDVSWLPHNQEKLLGLGHQIHEWLDGQERWLENLRDAPDAPVIAEFAVRAQPDEQARRFLEAPWELAADGNGHLAAQASLMWAPVRRVGRRADPLPPNDKNRLGVMFMAAAPLSIPELDFEAEEAAILRAIERVGLDLVVEDSGNLDELGVAWRQGSLDALHVSCHGIGGIYPALALEGMGGELERVGLDRLVAAFSGRLPRLVFLSACHSGQNDAAADSLAVGLIGAGFPAALAWADAVRDADASAFAAEFYRQAAHRATSVQAAWALARSRLLRPERGRELSKHWHLARLFLGPAGGGKLAVGQDHRVASHDAGRKEIVEARGGRIEVASHFEFVGRRREIQTIRREFRHPDHAGVLLHGFGRQGKSSLAARIMDRHPDLTRVVLFQRCDGPSILGAIRERAPEAVEICDRWRDRVDPNRTESYDPDALYHALRALLDGPCSYVGSGKPILLVLDDFEALLDLPIGDGHWRVKPDVVASLTAIIRAFAQGGTDSRLLITSRYQFRIRTNGRDPALHLLSVQLAETSPANRLKQARQHVVALGRELPALTLEVTEAARGNAGLQDLLFKAVLADPAAGEAAIEALENYLGGGALPEQEELRETLEKLAVDKLLEPLTDDEVTLLRTSTLFQLPVPLTVWEKFTAGSNLGRPDRLLAFGLWERLPDIADPHADAASPNAIAVTRLPPLPDEDAKGTIGAVLPDLFAAWGGTDRAKTPYSADIELTRLALICGNLEMLAATAGFAIRGLERAFAYREAVTTATAALDALESGGRTPETHLLRAAAEVFDHVGDPRGLRRIYANAGELGRDDPSQPSDARLARASFRLRYGVYLWQLGQTETALDELRAASSVFGSLGARRWRAVAKGHIALIMKHRGELDQALKLHREELRIYEALGDRVSRAVALGEIARIMTAEGDVNEALALHRERLQIFEALSDRRERAVTLGDIARIMSAKGDVNEALALHRERLQICEALADGRERAATLGEIARIMSAKGDVDEALELHRQQRQIFEALEDRRSRAAVLGDIGRIMRDKGDLDAALKLHQEQLQIYEALGDRGSRAVALGDIAQIIMAKGEVDVALGLQNERLEVNRQLGDQDGIAAAHFDIAQIQLVQAKENRDANVFQLAIGALMESFEIFVRIGRLDGICVSGLVLGEIFAAAGQNDEAREILQVSLDAFRKLGRAEEASQAEELLRQLQ
jgi:tetratricopeptide (TPR) repeat protein